MADKNKNKERRKHIRVETDESVLLVGSDVFGAVLDLSMGGLACAVAEDDEDGDMDLSDVGLLFSESGLYIGGVEALTVSDQPLAKASAMSPRSMRRRGVRFDSLSPEQQEGLQRLLKKFLKENK